jgi:hypothetical protein
MAPPTAKKSSENQSRQDGSQGENESEGYDTCMQGVQGFAEFKRRESPAIKLPMKVMGAEKDMQEKESEKPPLRDGAF